MKGVMRFKEKSKLSPRYIGPFEILERIGEVAYQLALLLGCQVSILYFIFQCLRSIIRVVIM